jgi:hypothetical protein
MRRLGVTAVCVSLALVAGCEESMRGDAGKQNLDRELVTALNDAGVKRAIITEHTLYPYHFIGDGQELNDLGKRNFSILADHLSQHAGILNVRRGDAG